MRYPRWFRIGFVLAGLLTAATPAAHAGGLLFVEAQESLFEPSLQSANAVAVSATALYVAADDDGGSLSIWNRNPATCELTFSGAYHDGELGIDNMRRPTAVAVGSDGCLYLTSASDDSVVWLGSPGVGFKKDGVSGVDGLKDANGLALSSDGLHLYVSGRGDDAVAVFSRSDCGLTFVEKTPTVDAPEALALSGDGKFLYVAGGDPPEVDVFSRDAGTGALTSVETVPVVRLSWPVGAIAVHDDNVYLGVAGSNAVVVFTRDAATGTLTSLETQHGGPVTGIAGVSGLAVSPDGRSVYSTGALDAAVAVFARDATPEGKGRLRFLESRDHSALTGSDTFRNVLERLRDIAVSPDGHCVYPAGEGAFGSVSVFEVDACGNGVRGVDEQCDDGNSVAGDGCSDTCRLELCDGGPLPGCRKTIQPGGASLGIKNFDDDARDRLSWKWRGEATTLGEFGDPTTAASYLICVFDDAAPLPPLMSLAAPAGGMCIGKPCWKATATAYAYKDLLLTPDGVKQVRVKEGGAGKAMLRFEALGNFLSPPLPLPSSVTVQVTNTDTNVCWEAKFSAPTVTTEAQFKAKSD